MTVEELKKYVGKCVSFTQLGDGVDAVGFVKLGKLFLINDSGYERVVCCFKSSLNPNATSGFSWIGRPKEFDRS